MCQAGRIIVPLTFLPNLKYSARALLYWAGRISCPHPAQLYSKEIDKCANVDNADNVEAMKLTRE